MFNSITKSRVLTTSAIALLVSGVLFSSGANAVLSSEIAFNIPAENAAKALNDFSSQSGVQILFPYDAAAKVSVPALKGTYTRRQALDLILANTGLEVASETKKTITLRIAPPKVAEPKAEAPTEVIVTGTHIRGGNPTSPVHTVTRKDIEQSGYSQIGDVMRSLPENFSGGQNPGVFAADATNAGNANLSGASTINLRGLGTDATLVLVNGHRLSADGYFQASDISGVPLGAVQRIEVVPDGASALYGSDAVAGVVNIILKKAYTGAQVSLQGGAPAQGGGTQRSVSALGGVRSGNWFAMANVEYAKQDAITAADRKSTSAATPETGLYPALERKSLFLSAGGDISDRLSIALDAMITDRQMDYAARVSIFAPLQYINVATPAYSVALSSDVQLPGDWKLRATALAAGGRNSALTTYPAYNFSSRTVYRNSLQSFELTADGTVAHLPSGDVKAAVGAGYRTESFSYLDTADREVSYVFGEALVPLVSPSATRAGLNELEVSLSARTEHYSDFGDAAVPKIGIRYMPFPDLTVRGTWGKSFKAPRFLQMYQTRYLYLLNASDMGGNSGTAFLAQGGNPDLKPEKSTAWTLGADYNPAALKSLHLSATYFHIDYRDRIIQPAPIVFDGLSNPIYAPFVELAPSAARQSELIAGSDQFENYASGAYDPSDVVAVLQNRYTNATAQLVKGWDLSYRQVFTLPHGNLSAFANATLMTLDQQFVANSPVKTLSGTIFNVPETKARGGLNWEIGGLSATALVNFVSSEIDTGVVTQDQIASWTTADLTLGYRFRESAGAVSGLRLAFAVTNLFDKTPPYAISPSSQYPGIHFDSANTSIVGRFVSLSVTKVW